MSAVVGPLAGWTANYLLTARQAAVEEQPYDRAAGKMRAAIEVKLGPPQRDLPAQFRLRNDFVQDAVFFAEVDHLLAVNPVVVVTNVGEEAIEAVRVETAFREGFIDGRNAPKDVIGQKTPWVLRRSSGTSRRCPRS